MNEGISKEANSLLGEIIELNNDLVENLNKNAETSMYGSDMKSTAHYLSIAGEELSNMRRSKSYMTEVDKLKMAEEKYHEMTEVFRKEKEKTKVMGGILEALLSEVTNDDSETRASNQAYSKQEKIVQRIYEKFTDLNQVITNQN